MGQSGSVPGSFAETTDMPKARAQPDSEETVPLTGNINPLPDITFTSASSETSRKTPLLFDRRPIGVQLFSVSGETSSPTIESLSDALPAIRATPSRFFEKTIDDLEGLLNEALQIAQVTQDEREAEGNQLRSRLAQLTNQVRKERSFDESADHEELNTRKALDSGLSSHVHQPSGLRVNPEQADRRGSYVAQQDWAQKGNAIPSLQRNPSFRVQEDLSPLQPASSSQKTCNEHVHRRKPSRDIEPDGFEYDSPQHAAVTPSDSPRQLRRARTVAERRMTFAEPKPQPMIYRQKTSQCDDDEDKFSDIFALDSPRGHGSGTNHIGLRGFQHIDIQGPADFDVHETSKRQPVARDWSPSRKRFAAMIACINTAVIGTIIGMYAGEVPAFQYVLVDLNHHAIRGNVYFYVGIAISTLLFWPLPLLHGRKPYTILGLAAALCLQIPQGIAVTEYRSPDSPYLLILLLSRGFLGLALGFTNINLQASLLDLFGASLQSQHPHEEAVDVHDVRRHGGGMGSWLGFWSWCYMGSIALGFFIGTLMVKHGCVAWGFWTVLGLLMIVLLLNVIGPEVRGSAYRRTVAELMGADGNVNSRICRGEVKMHLKFAGPYWWGEEVKAGFELTLKMLKQPGFVVLAIYIAWVYAHFTLVLMPVFVGLCVLALGLGGAVALPFEKGSFFSRARKQKARTDSLTLVKSLTWSSHLLRRTIFTALLPVAGLGYTFASKGPPLSVAAPAVVSGVIGFLTNLAIAECNGIVMETFDTSDLQPGMTGKLRRATIAARGREQRTNFTCYPRVMAGFSISQSMSFLFAAVATGICSGVERRLGALQSSAVVAGVLLGLTVLLTFVLVRFRIVRMIPDTQPEFAPQFMTRANTTWEPIILGRPSGKTRKISILEAGQETRWSEIRRKNRLTEN